MTDTDAQESLAARAEFERALTAISTWVAAALPDDDARRALVKSLALGAELHIELRLPASTALVTFAFKGKRHRLLEIVNDDGKVH